MTAKRLFSFRFAVCAPARVTRLPGSESGACVAGSHSPWPPPLAPPAPRPVARLCSSASQLLWQSLTSRDRASSATAPRLPDADRRRLPNGRSRDLPVPAQGASAHARVFDHAGSSGARDDALGCVAFHHMHGVGTQDRTLSRLDGWPMRSPVNASPRPSRATAHDLGPMWIATPSSQGTFTLYSLPVSRRFAYVVRFSPDSRHKRAVPALPIRAKSGSEQSQQAALIRSPCRRGRVAMAAH